MSHQLALLILGLLAAAYIAGRYSAPEKVRVETVTVERVVERMSEQKQTEQVRVITKIERPGGTTITRTRVEAKSDTNLVALKDSQTAATITKVIENRRGVSVSALIGMPLTEIARGPVYGASFQKQFIGSVILGAWALTNLTVGLSVGIEL